jgi:hypothetical protein
MFRSSPALEPTDEMGVVTQEQLFNNPQLKKTQEKWCAALFGCRLHWKIGGFGAAQNAPGLVAKALADVEPSRVDRPDEVYQSAR